MDIQGLFVENFHLVAGLSPSADVFGTSAGSDQINLANYEKCVFIVHQKANATSTAGTATLKPQSLDNPSASNPADLPFYWAKKTTGASSVWSTPALVTSGGITTTANEDTIYAIEVSSRDLPAAQKYVRLLTTEVVNAPVIGSVLAILTNPRYGYPFNLDPLA